MARNRDLSNNGREILEALVSKSLEREKEFVRQEKLLRRDILVALGKFKVVEPLREIDSPTGRKSKLGELMKVIKPIT